jgi:heptosyltransferase-3
LLLANGLEPKGKWITINPFSRWKYKEWDNAKWTAVIDQIWEMYRMPAVLIGAPEEFAGCSEIILKREGRAFNLAGQTKLDELAAVISMSSLHLGVDSAAPHIAAALGTPTVTVHGPTDWRSWRVADANHRVVNATMDCIPCSMTGCDGSNQSRCLEDLDILPVLSAANDILGSPHAH